MCLDITKTLRPTKKIVSGYKAFIEHRNGDLTVSYHSLNGKDREVIRGKWLQSAAGPGFHFFYKKEDAEKWGGIHNGHFYNKVLRVKVRRITGTGSEAFGMLAGVAQEIIIPREKK